jgi:methionine--tRNA ligase beta chain
MRDTMTISYDDFKKLDLRMGKVTAAEPIEGADKLLKLTVSLGEESRTIVAGIAQHHAPEAVVGRILPFILNIEPRTLKGVVSEGMLLACAKDGAEPVLLVPEKDVPPGTVIL